MIHTTQNNTEKEESKHFVWKVLTDSEACTVFEHNVFELYAVHEDETESLINNLEELTEYIECSFIKICVEVGHIRGYKFKNQ